MTAARVSRLASRIRETCVSLWCLSALFAASPLHAEQTPSLRLVQTIPLPGVEGRIDHLAIDTTTGRLFVAALGNNTVEVVDLHAGACIRSIGGLHEPQGIAYDPALNRIVVAEGEGGDVVILDAADFRVLRRAPLGDDADNVRYDAAAKVMYVGYGDGGLAVVDSLGARSFANVRLGGHPESFQLEEAGSRVFVNVPAASAVVVVDRANKSVNATWPVSEAASNYPMALDEAHDRLFVGCRRPSRLLVYDTATGRVTARIEIAGDTDDIFYDATRQLLYVVCGEGAIAVLRQDAPDHYTTVGSLSTSVGARTGLFVATLSRLFIAVPHRGKQKAEIRVYEL